MWKWIWRLFAENFVDVTWKSLFDVSVSACHGVLLDLSSLFPFLSTGVIYSPHVTPPSPRCESGKRSPKRWPPSPRGSTLFFLLTFTSHLHLSHSRHISPSSLTSLHKLRLRHHSPQPSSLHLSSGLSLMLSSSLSSPRSDMPCTLD